MRIRCGQSGHVQYLASLLGIIWVISAPLASAYDFQDCEGCHAESLASASARDYLHAPFAQGECGSCHAAKGVDEFTDSERKEQQKIQWLGSTATPSTSHGFLLPDKKVRELLVIDIKFGDGAFSRHEIPVPPNADLAEAEDTGSAPALSTVRVEQMKSGVVPTATVAWQTDTLADAQVRYGEQELTNTSGPEMRLGREHRVVLQNLRSDRTYRFTAISRDLFGRSRVSDPGSFSTAELQEGASPVAPERRNAVVGDTGFGYDFKRHGSDYLLELTFDRPALANVGSKGPPRNQDLPDDEFHAGLSGRAVMSMIACLNCHKPHLHPLNVAPKKAGVIIPPELPALPGGRISCSSCHAPHGTDYYFHLRKPEQELCASCHPKWAKEEKRPAP